MERPAAAEVAWPNAKRAVLTATLRARIVLTCCAADGRAWQEIPTPQDPYA